MLVTGVQAVGSKGVSAVQGAVVDLKESARLVGTDRDNDRSAGTQQKPGDPQPVVFPRGGSAIDKRPVSLRQQHAATRYRADGGKPRHDDAA